MRGESAEHQYCKISAMDANSYKNKMNRRHFIKNTSFGFAAIQLPAFPYDNWKDLIIGHGSHQYKVDLHWGALNANFYPVKDCHEMVIDQKGRIFLLTNHTKNNVLIYDASGRLLDTWGTTYPGAHGLTIKDEGGEEFLYIADNERHEVIKTTLDGREIMVLPFPKESGKYQNPAQYIPTETAIADNGDVYVADGYGLQYIIHYSAKGELLNIFGGRGTSDEHLDNAHGVCIDQRDAKNPQLLVTDRMKNQLKTYTLEGKFKGSIDLPGAYICRPVIKEDFVYLATIWSGASSSGAGFVSILNKKNELISAPGGIEPTYSDGKLNPMHQSLKVFHHPHDVCVDKDDNLYVAQWNSGQTYPIKLIRV